MEFKDIGVVVKAAHGGDFPENERLHGGIQGGRLVDYLNGNFGVVVIE